MTKLRVLSAAVLAVLTQSLQANPIFRQAIITGRAAENGRCTIGVTVDGAAEVEVAGDHGLLTTLSGQRANWRRFQCTEPMPRNPTDFRFVSTDSPGSIRLRVDPRKSGGRAVIQVDGSDGGRTRYSFDLLWRRSGNGDWASGPNPYPPSHWPLPGGGGEPVPGPPLPPPGPWPGSGAFPITRAIQVCQGSVTSRLNRDGYVYITFERAFPDNNPGRRDWISGTVSGRRKFEITRFAFSCSVDFTSGKVRWFDVKPY